jgi:hypothetical protein
MPMTDEPNALRVIADMLQQLMNERSQITQLQAQMLKLSRSQFGLGSGRPDFEKQREEREERLREIREEGALRHESQMQMLEKVLVALERHNEAMERHNELIERLLGRER